MDHIFGRPWSCAVRVSLTEAKSRLTDLVRRAEAGDDVILTRHGQAAARIVSVAPTAKTPKDRRRLLEEIWEAGRTRRLAGEILHPGEDAARSQDFLYDENGLPG